MSDTIVTVQPQVYTVTPTAQPNILLADAGTIQIVTVGIQGPGTPPGTFLTPANNLSDVASADDSVANLIAAMTHYDPSLITSKKSYFPLYNSDSSLAYYVTGDNLLNELTATFAVFFAKTRASVTQTDNYTIGGNEGTIVCNTTNGGFTVTLPTAVGRTGQQYAVTKSDASANNVTIAGISGQTINGAATLVFNTRYRCYTLESDGANWIIISQYN